MSLYIFGHGISCQNTTSDQIYIKNDKTINAFVINKETNENLLKIGVKKEILKENPKWGTLRSLVANAVIGVSEGFSKKLELVGTGYKASISGNTLKLFLGYSHEINYKIPEGIKIECPKPNNIKLFSHNKELLGKVSSEIRSYRKPEPFKGKGIRYENEYIFRKEGKKK